MRYERRERKYKQITPRDLQIVEATFYARYVTREMVQRLFFSPGASSNCKTRLRLLFDRGYLRKREVYPSDPDVYFLGLKGKRYMMTKGYEKEYVDKVAGTTSRARVPLLMMHHELTLSQIYTDSRCECDANGVQFEWRNTRMLEMLNLGVQPDAFIKVTRSTSKSAFIEYTDALPKSHELQRKIEGYQSLPTAVQLPILWFVSKESSIRPMRVVFDSPIGSRVLLSTVVNPLTEPMLSSQGLVHFARLT